MHETVANYTDSRPEDIFGSLEVDAQGNIEGKNGNYQNSGKISIS